MAAREDITPELLRQLLRLDEATGTLYWVERDEKYFSVSGHAAAWNKRYAGKEVGQSVLNTGYCRISVLQHNIYVHRIVFAMTHGRWPAETVDHINRDRTDNRPCNLREATYAQNNCNIKPTKANKSGYKGVYWVERSRKWQALIGYGGKRKFLGAFTDIQDAVRAYEAASVEYHKEFRTV